MIGINERVKLGKRDWFILKENSFDAQNWEKAVAYGHKINVFSESIHYVYLDYTS